MPRRFTGKLCHFLFEHLDQGTFPEQLCWLDRRSGVFQLLWKHGNGGTSTPDQDCAVFMAWDRIKDRRFHCRPMQAKQRFRAAMTKMRLRRLMTWKLRSPGKDFQFRKFPKEDLNYLLNTGKRHTVVPRWRKSSVENGEGDDKISDQDSDCTSSKEQPSELSDANFNLRRLRDAFRRDWSQCGTLCSDTPPDEIFGSADCNLLVNDESQDESSLNEFIIPDLGCGFNFAKGNLCYEEEVKVCRCSGNAPGPARCLFCILVEYADPPIDPVFRFDLAVPVTVCRT